MQQVIDKEMLEYASDPAVLAGFLDYVDADESHRRALIARVLKHLGEEASERQTAVAQMFDDLIE